MKNNPFVSVVIANYNGEKYLSTCLDSVIKSQYPNREIIIIDDGSNDKSISIIEDFKKKNPEVSIIRNPHNIGAAASRNKAIKVARGEFIVFLDNDTEVEKAWLSEMVATLNSAPDIGGCQALLLDFKERKKIQNAGGKLWAATGWQLPQYQWAEYKSVPLQNSDIIAISAALAVKKDICSAVTGFDEQESVFTEDLDFSWRIWLLGQRIVLSPNSRVFHWTKYISMRKDMNHTNKIVYFHLVKNSLTSILKNYETRNAIKYFFYSFMICWARAFYVLVRRRDNSSLVGTAMGMGWVTLHMAQIIKKRHLIQKNRILSDDELFVKVISRESVFGIYKKHFMTSNTI